MGLALAVGGCSGGGGSDNAGLDDEFRPRDVQFLGAAKLKMGATLAVPPDAKGALPAVLIIPAHGATNSDGLLTARPPDPLYKDLSASLTAAAW